MMDLRFPLDSESIEQHKHVATQRSRVSTKGTRVAVLDVLSKSKVTFRWEQLKVVATEN